jgi:hypothetical protein
MSFSKVKFGIKATPKTQFSNVFSNVLKFSNEINVKDFCIPQRKILNMIYVSNGETFVGVSLQVSTQVERIMRRYQVEKNLSVSLCKFPPR